MGILFCVYVFGGSINTYKEISISRPNIAIIFSDGVQTKDSFWEIPKGFTDASQPLKDKGVRVIAVGGTANANKERLRLFDLKKEQYHEPKTSVSWKWKKT